MTRDGLSSRAQAAILGALIGDAAGSVAEFQSNVTPETAARALTLPGGGPFSLAPGQITDDGELTMCLLRALASGPEFDIERNARCYADWICSEPFDIGNTTLASLGCIRSLQSRNRAMATGYAAVMSEAARANCRSSQANGSLMRASPLGVRGYRLSDEELARWAHEDSGLSHPNRVCQDAVAAYSIAIATLLQTDGAREQAFARAWNWARNNAADEVVSLLSKAQNGISVPFGPRTGWVGIAFGHAFRHLLAGTGFPETLQAVIEGGGDTDTNACIAGGLIGAATGLEGIPEAMTGALLSCDPEKGRHPRPGFLHPRHVRQHVEKILTFAAGGAF